jgi:DNA primase
MAYDIDGIKQRNSIEDVISAHGVALRESGTHLVGRCPFHEDEHPSFAVYPQTRSFYCFGCNAGGDPSVRSGRAPSTSWAAPRT